jgi:hypothetical protein
MSLSFSKLVVGSHYGIRDLILDMLVLDEKLQDVENQSVYFRWAVEANRERLVRLIKRYEGLRKEYNRMAVDDLLELIKKEEEFVIPSSFPLHGKQILKSRQLHLINKYRDYLSLKSEVPELPAFDDLKRDESLIEKTLATD